jgi:dihydrofolate reductase
MRKLKLQMQITIDGFVAGPNGELDWMLLDWDKELINYVTEFTDSVDLIVMGRKLAEGFIPYWKNVASDVEDAQQEAGKIFTNLPKVVFTKTLEKSIWDNTTVEKNIANINELKSQEGKDIVVYGGATFVSSLIKSNLIDEYHLFVNPVAIGTGLQIFSEAEQNKKLKLIKSTHTGNGIVVCCYEPLK